MELFHVGLTVTDLTASARNFGMAFGVQWRPVVEYPPHDLWTLAGVKSPATRRVYSLAGPPYVELVEDVAGLVWGGDAPAGTHHLGYWSDDLIIDGRRLEDIGATMLVTNLGDQEPGTRFRYYAMPSGELVELLPRDRADLILNT